MYKPYNEDLFNKAIKFSGLDEDIDTLRHGIFTIVGDKGHLLSKYWRIRLCLARAIYQDNKTIVMDDIFEDLYLENPEKFK